MLTGLPSAPVDGGEAERDAFSRSRLAALFAGLSDARLLLAVSGGPDSLALLHLAARWGGAELHVATVDHGLRPGSRAEAADVAAAADALGLPHATLAWDGAKPRTRVQELARAARYALLAAHAEAIGATHLLTAHHADDQAETVLFRLGRGSGLTGLAGMRRETSLRPGLALVRPLLACAKAELVAVCAAAGQAFAEDPSNSNPATARGRLRAAAPAAASLGLDTAALTRLAARMARADAALDAVARRRLDQLGGCAAEGRFAASAAALATAEGEIVVRVLALILAHVVPGVRPLRLDRLETLADALRTAVRSGTALRATLAGARLVLVRDGWMVVTPEAGRHRGRPTS